MTRVEIRYNKKGTVVILVLILAVTIAATYYIYFNNSDAKPHFSRIIFLFILALVVAFTASIIRKIRTNTPILIIDHNELIIQQFGPPITVPWSEVVDWAIETDPDGAPMNLKIVTTAGSHSFDLNTLDRSLEDIQDLLEYHKPKPRY